MQSVRISTEILAVPMQALPCHDLHAVMLSENQMAV
jgi:hypothetical protein